MITDMKQTGVPNRTPFSAAQGNADSRTRVQTVKPVQTGNAGLSRPVMSNQDRAAANATGSGAAQPSFNPIQPAPPSMIPQSLQNYQASPVSSTYPNGASDYSARMRDVLRASSAKNGPTPVQHIPTGNWWDQYAQSYSPAVGDAQQTEPDSSMFGPWVTDNAALPSEGTAPNQNYDPDMVVRNALRNMKNSDIMRLLVDISNGKIKGLSE